jgi:copper chaperone CopZ
MTHTITLAVTGEQPIHCTACERRIVAVLRRLEGVVAVTARAADQRVTVTCDPDRVSVDALLDRLARAGFTAVPAGGAP